MLAPFLGYIGLAIATTMSASLNAFWLYQGLKKQQVFQLSIPTKIFIVKMLIAALVMALGVYYYSPPFDVWLAMSVTMQIMYLVIAIALGLFGYFFCLLILGVRLEHFKIKADKVTK
jgi:putative peptidoglycan lipid II flippase